MDIMLFIKLIIQKIKYLTIVCVVSMLFVAFVVFHVLSVLIKYSLVFHTIFTPFVIMNEFEVDNFLQNMSDDDVYSSNEFSEFDDRCR
jgi:hypothetical protein